MGLPGPTSVSSRLRASLSMVLVLSPCASDRKPMRFVCGAQHGTQRVGIVVSICVMMLPRLDPGPAQASLPVRRHDLERLLRGALSQQHGRDAAARCNSGFGRAIASIGSSVKSSLMPVAFRRLGRPPSPGTSATGRYRRRTPAGPACLALAHPGHAPDDADPDYLVPPDHGSGADRGRLRRAGGLTRSHHFFARHNPLTCRGRGDDGTAAGGDTRGGCGRLFAPDGRRRSGDARPYQCLARRRSGPVAPLEHRARLCTTREDGYPGGNRRLQRGGNNHIAARGHA